MAPKGTAFVSHASAGAQLGPALPFNSAAVRPRPVRRARSYSYDGTRLMTRMSEGGEVRARKGEGGVKEETGPRPSREIETGTPAAVEATAAATGRKNAGNGGLSPVVAEVSTGGYADVHSDGSANSNMRRQGAMDSYKDGASSPPPHARPGVVRRVTGTGQASAAARQPVYGSPLELEVSAKREGVSVSALVRSRSFVKKIRGLRKFGSWEKALRDLDQAEREEWRVRQREQGGVAGSRHGGVVDLTSTGTGSDGAGSSTMRVGMADRSYEACLAHIVRSLRCEEALGLLDHMRSLGITPDVRCVSLALNACGRAGQWERCLELLREAREWGTELNEVSYNTAMSACARSYRPKEAVRLLREMPEVGLTPDARSYGAAMRACGSGGTSGAGPASVVLGLLREMEEEAGLRPTAQHYKYALFACSNEEPPPASRSSSSEERRVRVGVGGEAWEAAVELLRKMASEGVAADSSCYARAMLACKRAGRWQAALDLLREMKATGLTPDGACYDTVISALSLSDDAGQWKVARELLREQASTAKEARAAAAVAPKALKSAITAAGGAPTPAAAGSRTEVSMSIGEGGGGVEAAFTGASPPRWGPGSLVSYNCALTACKKAGRPQEAVALLREMRREGRHPDLISYNTTISACVKGREWQTALAILREMQRTEESGVVPDVYSYGSVITACSTAGKVKLAVAVFDEMREAGVSPDAFTFNSLATAYAKGGRWREALATLAEMSALGLVGDSVSYTAAIRACGRAGECDRALSLLQQVMPERGLRPDGNAFAAAISACGIAGRWERGLELLSEMADTTGVVPCTACYTSAIKACGKGRQWEQAFTLLREMVTEGAPPDARSYEAAIIACGTAGRWDKAVGLVREMEEKGVQPHEICYAAAIKACHKAQELDTAAALQDELNRLPPAARGPYIRPNSSVSRRRLRYPAGRKQVHKKPPPPLQQQQQQHEQLEQQQEQQQQPSLTTS
ncbi:unnamed protein product [Scytosiphon promiscuus]